MLSLLIASFLVTAAPAGSGPLTDAERADLQGKPCEPFVTAFKAAGEKAKANPVEGQTPNDAMDAAMKSLKRPSSMKAAEWDRCISLFQRDLLAYRAKSIEIEAKVSLKSFATSMKMYFADQGKLCPATRAPVPADLSLVAKGPWTSTAADWADPAWVCVVPPELSKQRFQYEIKTDEKAGTFELIARGYPANDGTLVTFTLPGKIVNGAIETGEIQRQQK